MGAGKGKTAKTSKRPERKSIPRSRKGRRAPATKYAGIRTELERQRAALVNEAGDSLANRPGGELYPDVSDQASAEVDQNFDLRMKERGQKLLRKIDEALERMEQGTYGICERCENEIPFQRLKARPVTTLCIECKTLQEQEERMRR